VFHLLHQPGGAVVADFAENHPERIVKARVIKNVIYVVFVNQMYYNCVRSFVMPKTNTIHMRIRSDIKYGAEVVLDKLGLTTADAITIFLNQVILNDGLPFEVKMPKWERTPTTFIADRLVGLVPPDVDERKIKTDRFARQ
jgi:addiction module RelB/DinJ family antitoxin